MTPCPSRDPNSNDISPVGHPLSTSGTPLTLRLRGVGHIVSFKNTKMLLPAKGDRPAMLITAPEKQKAMKEYIRVIEYELCSAFRTSETATPTGRKLRSWIASSVPLDDSVKWIRSLAIDVEDVEAGEEGADIIIERIPETGQLLLDESKPEA